jgi:DNA-binding protein HU-beta
MNKMDLVGRIAKEAKISKATAARALDSAISTITEALKKNHSVTLVGFGTFTTAERKSRMGRDPQTKKEIRIPAKRVPKFRAGKALRALVNKK